MPFKEIDIDAIIEEKKRDSDFQAVYDEVDEEYRLIRKVIEARNRAGLSQTDLAKIVGTSQQEISRFEKERHVPKLSKFIKIVNAVGLTIQLEKKDQ